MRTGSLIKLKPEYEERYIILHKHTFPGVLARIRKSNIRNYSIFLCEGMLFSYWEYIGDDFEGDMAEIGRDSETQDWWKLTDPMQEPLATRREGERWASAVEIFHWSKTNVPRTHVRRMALTTRILKSFESQIIESLKIAYPIMVETSQSANIQNFSVYHKDGHLYSYIEFKDENAEMDIDKVQASLKVEDELDWQPMKEVFHTD